VITRGFLKVFFEQRGILGRRQHLGQQLPSCYNCCLVPMKSFEGIYTVGDIKKPFVTLGSFYN
jgi:hypothetical protein